MRHGTSSHMFREKLERQFVELVKFGFQFISEQVDFLATGINEVRKTNVAGLCSQCGSLLKNECFFFFLDGGRIHTYANKNLKKIS
jgi:hypothetical protein